MRSKIGKSSWKCSVTFIGHAYVQAHCYLTLIPFAYSWARVEKAYVGRPLLQQHTFARSNFNFWSKHSDSLYLATGYCHCFPWLKQLYYDVPFLEIMHISVYFPHALQYYDWCMRCLFFQIWLYCSGLNWME